MKIVGKPFRTSCKLLLWSSMTKGCKVLSLPLKLMFIIIPTPSVIDRVGITFLIFKSHGIWYSNCKDTVIVILLVCLGWRLFFLFFSFFTFCSFRILFYLCIVICYSWKMRLNMRLVDCLKAVNAWYRVCFCHGFESHIRLFWRECILCILFFCSHDSWNVIKLLRINIWLLWSRGKVDWLEF